MAIQITIIGLGQVGASIGLALEKIKDQAVRIGNDRDAAANRQAERMGAVDKTIVNLPASVENADVVILALPVDEIRETMEIISQDLKPGSVLIDTSPATGAVMQWAKELLPGEDRYFVAMVPSLNPAYLMETVTGTTNARADLFKNSLMMLTALPGTDESAITLAMNIAQVLGVSPNLADPLELDGLEAYSHVLPQLVSAALVNATIDQPGWLEARKLASHAYAQATEPVLHLAETKALGQTALLNPQNTVRMLDQTILALRELRDAIEKQDAAGLQGQLEHARAGRETWWSQRLAGSWESTGKTKEYIPTSGEFIGRLFGLRPKKSKDAK